MGCDIHLFKEKFVDGKWVTADEWVPYDNFDDETFMEVPFEKTFTDRNYNLFGLLAKGVRRDHDFSFEQRGVPFDASEEYKAEIERYGSDGHSHSYLFLHELKAMHSFLANHKITISGMKNKDELEALKASASTDSPDWHLLYPFCQGTNDSKQVHFEIDVPALFIVGGGLEKIIALFDGVDGENHRIVFYFDN